MSTYERVLILTHEIGPEGSLVVRTVGGHVGVRAVDGGEVRVQATLRIHAADQAEADRIFDQVDLVRDRRSGRLELAVPDVRGPSLGGLLWVMGRRRLAVDFDIATPAATSLRVEDVSAEVHVDGLVGVQRHRTASGERRLVGVAGDVVIEGMSGDARVQALGDLALEVRTVSGDVRVVAQLLKVLRVSTVSGDVDVEAILGSDGVHSVETISGDLLLASHGGVAVTVRGLSTAIRGSGLHRVEGRPGEREVIIGDGRSRLRFSSMSGDVVVRSPVVMAQAPGQAAEVASPAKGGTASTEMVTPAEAMVANEPPPTERDEAMAVLRALEEGRIGVDEAATLLALAGVRNA